MATLSMAITVTRERRATIEAVARDVSTLGVTVEHVLPAIGAIYGRADESCLAAVATLPGVARVRPAGEVRLAPLDPRLPQ